MLETNEAHAVLAISLMAAMADGRTGSEEREHLRSLFDSLSSEHDLPDLPALYQSVLMRRTSLDAEAAKLSSDEAKSMAFEMAVCVADADGTTTDAEQKFLDTLERALGLDHGRAVAFEQDAETIALADDRPEDDRMDADALLGPIDTAPAGVAAGAATLPEQTKPAQLATAAQPSAGDLATHAAAKETAQAVDSPILKYAILNGALELMPQNLATMAILPLQTRMVYVVGKHHGYTLGAGHIKEFIATLGLGATGQMLENFARKALGKLARKTLGKTAGKVAYAATGPMMTFATTYAIGRVASTYYAGGRTLSSLDLKSMFTRELDRGKSLYDQHSGSIGQRAASLNPADVMRAVKGGGI
ncbi:MAG: TerB family tellurite resistance protein [Phycisphaerales bacterium]